MSVQLWDSQDVSVLRQAEIWAIRALIRLARHEDARTEATAAAHYARLFAVMTGQHPTEERFDRFKERKALTKMVAAWSLCLLVYPLALLAQTLTGPARVVDGDTLEVQGRKVRLHGIDAPEIRQTCTRAGKVWACGVAARRHLEELIARRPVTCAQTDTDRYGRVVARCFVGEPHVDLGGWMVRQGHAVAYTRYSTDYIPQETVARGARLGLWSGAFVAPWDWRKGVR